MITLKVLKEMTNSQNQTENPRKSPQNPQKSPSNHSPHNHHHSSHSSSHSPLNSSHSPHNSQKSSHSPHNSHNSSSSSNTNSLQVIPPAPKPLIRSNSKLPCKACLGHCQRLLPVAENFDESSSTPDICKFCKRMQERSKKYNVKEEIIEKAWEQQQGRCKFCESQLEGCGKVFTDKSRKKFICFVCSNCYKCGKAVAFDPENIKIALRQIFEEKQKKVKDYEDHASADWDTWSEITINSLNSINSN